MGKKATQREVGMVGPAAEGGGLTVGEDDGGRRPVAQTIEMAVAGCGGANTLGDR